MNPWHDIKIGASAPEVVTGVIEIPNGSKIKYELDKDTGMLKLDRVLFTSMRYPANYGFIPKTYCDDGDPLDILVISQVDIAPMCLVNCRLIGVMNMIDGGEVDDKIIAVANDDVSMNNIEELKDLQTNLLDEIENFFSGYKTLEKKEVKVNAFKPKKEAIAIVKKAIEDYNAKFN